MRTIQYFCDVCGQKQTSESFLSVTRVQLWSDGMLMKEFLQKDVCNPCRDKIFGDLAEIWPDPVND